MDWHLLLRVLLGQGTSKKKMESKQQNTSKTIKTNSDGTIYYTSIDVGDTIYYTGDPIMRNGRPADGVITLGYNDVFYVGEGGTAGAKYAFRGPQTIDVYLSRPEWGDSRAIYGITRIG